MKQEHKRIGKHVLIGDSSEDYVYDASVNALTGEIVQPIRQVISPQAFILLRGGEGFSSRANHGYSVAWLVSFAFARTHVAGSASVEGWNTLANATIEKLNLFDIVTADKIVAQVSIDRAKEKNALPKVSFLGTTFDNLRIGGRAIEIDLETGVFEHGGIGLKSGPSGDDRHDPQRPGSSHGSLVKIISGSLPSGASRNSVALQGFGTLFLSELFAEGDSYQLKMIRLVTSSGGEITVATCRASIGLSELEARHQYEP